MPNKGSSCAVLTRVSSRTIGLLLVGVASLVSADSPPVAQPKAAPKPAAQATARPAAPQSQIDTSKLVPCADIEIASLSLSLASSTVGTPEGGEFPTDTISVEARIKNVGAGSLPAGSRVVLTLTRNGAAVVTGVDITSSVSAPGSSFTWRKKDQFPHLQAQKYEYRLTATPSGVAECRTDNNSRLASVTEAALHPGGTPDLAVDAFYCERKAGEGGSADFDCHVMVKNVGDGAAASGSTVDVRRKNDGTVLATTGVRALNLPMPGNRKDVVVKLAAGTIPSGSYEVVAHVAKLSNENNTANNTSSSTVLIKQLQLFLAAVPTKVTSGGNVTLKWDAMSADPGAQIAYRGRLSGMIRNLPAAGERVVCPYGTTTYTLTHPAYPGRSARVTVPAECPRNLGLNDPALDALVANGTITEGLLREHPEITINPGSPVLRIAPTGISMVLKGVYHKKHLPGIDIKVSGLAWPWVDGGTYRVDMKKFDVEIGSDATRAAWDIATLGLYEGVKKGLEDWAEKKVRAGVAGAIAAELQRNLPCGAGRFCFLELRAGEMTVIRCTQCHYPSASGMP